jgi:HPt (histidine-containing phosphotransfer) domain-containing protein
VELPVFDVPDVLNRVEDDRELLAELVTLFLEDYPRQLDKIDEALSQHKAHLVERLAHSLKSALANLSAKRAADAARQLETMARAGDLHGATQGIRHLQDEMDTLRHVMEQFLQTSPT